MRPQLRCVGLLALLGMALLLCPRPALAAACSSSGSGNWSTITWSCGHVPVAGDDVTIANTVTLDVATPSLASLTVNAGAVLDLGSANGAGTLLVKGDLVNGGTIQNSAGETQVNSIAVGGRWVNNATFTAGTGSAVTPRIDVTLSGTSIGGTAATSFNNLTLSAASPVTATANVTVNGAITCASTISAVGTTFTYNQAAAGQNVCAGNYGSLTFSAYAKTLPSTGVVGIAATFTPGTANTVLATGTISFNGTAAQNIPAITYNNLDISSTSTATLAAGTTTVSGTLSLTSGTLAVGARTLNANGPLTLTAGTFSVTTGSVTAAGPLTLTAGTLSVTTGSVTANGTVTCGSTTITSGNGGTVSYNGPVGQNQNVCAGNYGNLTLGNSDHTLAATGTIGIAGTFTPGSGTTTVTGSTVNFNRTSAQNIPAFTFNNLTVSGGGTSTMQGNVTANGTLTLSGGTLATGGNVLTANGPLTLTAGTLSVGTGSVTAAGTVTCGSTITSGATGTVSYTALGDQTVCGGTYGILNTSGSGTKSLAGNVTTTGAVNVGGGTTLDQGSTTNTLSSGGLMTVASGGAFTNTGTGTLTLNGGLTNNGTFLVGGNGGTCGGTTRATITSVAVQTWTGTGSFQLVNVTLKNQNNQVGGTITAFNATSTGGDTGFTLNATCTGAPSPTAVRLVSFTATVHGSRVLLKWQTAMETNNIGFRLYREAGDASSPVTPHLISGSALMAGLRATVSGGRSYVWWDDLPAGGDARTTRYWLADVDLRGGQTFHGPVLPQPSNDPPPEVRNAPQLQQLAGLTGSGASPGSSVQGGPAGRVLRGLAPTTLTATAVQWTLASSRALKIGISQAGWYQVTGQDLIDHGLGTADPTRLQLFADGQQIPLVIRGLARSRSLVPQSTVEFYATGIDTQWTGERSYWLAAGTSAGKRVGKVSAEASDAAPASFAFTVASAPKVIYFPALMNGNPDNKYFGPIVSTDATAPTTLALDVINPDAAPAGQAALDVAVQGVMDGAHVVAVLLNGTQVGQVQFDSQELGTAHLLLDQSTSLIEGSNQISLWAEGGDLDLSLVASVGLTYWRKYVADGDTLSMTAPGDSRLVVSGFNSPNIRVMDVTDTENPYELSAAVQSDGTSGYSVTTDVAGAGVRNLLAFTDGAIASPDSLETDSPSSWHSADKAANLVVLTNAAVTGALQPLVKLRQGQGYVVAVVDVEDVYDEFSFGNKTPQALRDFLALASSTWRKRPGFVLLAGSASADPRNFLGYGDFDLVPTEFVDATYNYAASDDWLVDFNNDGLPDLAIGRLPVRDSTQAAAVVQKLVGYAGTAGADWRRTAVLVSDTATSDFDFPAASTAVAAQIPTSMFLTQIFRGDFADDTAAHAAVVGAFDQGALLVNYMGHSSETAWDGNLLSMDDVPLLTNGAKLPFVSSMTCWTGWFADPYGETLGESLLKTPQGGAIAVWASSGMTESAGQQTMDAAFMQLLFAAKKPTIGQAVAAAKAATSDLDVRRTWILLGDPTTRLQ